MAGAFILRSLIAFCLSRRLLVLVAFAAFISVLALLLARHGHRRPLPRPGAADHLIMPSNKAVPPRKVERYIRLSDRVAVTPAAF